MTFFNLPPSTVVNKVIPKNSFYPYANAKQKKEFADYISKITWENKLSQDTLNLGSKEIHEIQVFNVQSKNQTDFDSLLHLIDRAVPYPIIFIIWFENLACISTSVKHMHPTNIDRAVIDWTFKTDWLTSEEIKKYNFQLNTNIDKVYFEFCLQLAKSNSNSVKNILHLAEHNRKITQLEAEMNNLRSSISKAQQFNQKVELNLALQKKEIELKTLKKL
ncbi:DUF4391 domain-containing protein [bacterium]|nr:MAG: DUF4391 domain-containing protein [bacterium]